MKAINIWRNNYKSKLYFLRKSLNIDKIIFKLQRVIILFCEISYFLTNLMTVYLILIIYSQYLPCNK